LDRDLVEQAQRGDREAFAILARMHGDRLMAIAQRILRDIGRAEDAVQQTLVIAWRELPRLRDPDRFDAWLQRLVVNASYAEARGLRTWNANVRVLTADRTAGGDEALSVDDRDRLERGFRRLPPEQRAILVFTHYLGLTPTEIAARLGIPVGTANSRLHYALRAMRAAIEADERPVAVGAGRPR
jgi:RNA polymerase sigma-70 factor, ECF subfamily